MTNTLAGADASLRNEQLAKALTTVLLTALLRAYQAGARASKRAAEARADIDEQALVRVAEKSRQQAHAEDRSARLLLTHVHTAYGIDTPKQTFIRTFRRFPLPVLRQAERAFGPQAHRGDIRYRTAYFAAIVRRLHEEHRQRGPASSATKQPSKRCNGGSWSTRPNSIAGKSNRDNTCVPPSRR